MERMREREPSPNRPKEYRTQLIKRLEKKYQMPVTDLLREMYVDKLMSAAEIGPELGESVGTISALLRRKEISRSKSEAQKARWENPNKRKEMLKKIHNPEADDKRSQSLTEYWKRRRKKLQEQKMPEKPATLEKPNSDT